MELKHCLLWMLACQFNSRKVFLCSIRITTKYCVEQHWWCSNCLGGCRRTQIIHRAWELRLCGGGEKGECIWIPEFSHLTGGDLLGQWLVENPERLPLLRRIELLAGQGVDLLVGLPSPLASPSAGGGGGGGGSTLGSCCCRRWGRGGEFPFGLHQHGTVSTPSDLELGWESSSLSD